MNVKEAISLPLEDADIQYVERCFSRSQSDLYLNALMEQIPWRQEHVKVFGKTYLQPRLTALFGNTDKTYSYSSLTLFPTPYPPLLNEIRSEIETYCNVSFNCCLANLYRNGNDSNGWHSDNEKELGDQPVIASVSFGAERFFHLKHRNKKELRHKIKLAHGSLLIMKGRTQEHWLHQIPKTKQIIGNRINLTFRIII